MAVTLENAYHVFFMAVLVFAISISYLLLKQVIDFIVSIITEVNLRA